VPLIFASALPTAHQLLDHPKESYARPSELDPQSSGHQTGEEAFGKTDGLTGARPDYASGGTEVGAVQHVGDFRKRRQMAPAPCRKCALNTKVEASVGRQPDLIQSGSDI
jgi:hypothetical protein